MARTALTVLDLPLDTATVFPGATAIDVANGMSIALPTLGRQRLMIGMISTFAGAKTWTIRAGVPGANGWPAGAALGDMPVVFAAAGTQIIMASAYRFAQADGNVYIDFQAGSTGTIYANYTPRS